MQYPATAIRIGVASDLSVRTVNTAFVTFYNVTTALQIEIAGNGPGVDIGYCFWVWFEFCCFGGNVGEPIDSDKRAGIMIDGGPGGISPGLITVKDCSFNGGNIRYHCRSNYTHLQLENLVFEGDFVNPMSIPIHIDGVTAYHRSTIRNIEVADAPGTECGIKIEPATAPAEAVSIDGVSLGVIGPATVLTRYIANYQSVTKSPEGERQVGFWQGRVAGQHDSARRGFSPSVARFANLAPQDVTTWAAKIGSATVTTGKTAPDGTTNAAELSHASAAANKQIYRVNIGTPSVGEWIIAGGWVRGGKYH